MRTPAPHQAGQPPVVRHPAPSWRQTRSRTPGSVKSRKPRSTGFLSFHARSPAKKTAPLCVSRTAAHGSDSVMPPTLAGAWAGGKARLVLPAVPLDPAAQPVTLVP